MPDKPLTPTRIIPAGAPLPERPPAPGEIPPWRTPPPPPPPPAAPEPPAAPPQVIHVIHEIVLGPPEPDEEPPTRWDRVWAWMKTLGRPWQIALALGATVVPIPPGRYSAATTWAYVVHQTRLDHGPGWGYALGGGALALAATAVVRRGGVLRLTLLSIAFIGSIGAISLYDPITALTGVHR